MFKFAKIIYKKTVENLKNLVIRRRISTDLRKRIINNASILQVIDKVLRYTESLSNKGNLVGEYYYSSCSEHSVLYSSVYAVLLRDLVCDLDNLSNLEKVKWADYLNNFQCDDGLYRDQLLNNERADVIDWWGWRHLTAHVVTALTILNSRTKVPFKILEKLYGNGKAERWISSLDWENNAPNVSNTVMNYGVMLQYDRDFYNIIEAGNALTEIYDWLDKHQDAETGLWGNRPFNDKKKLSDGVQTSYHIWILYFYDNQPIQYLEKCINSCLKTQNEFGGFGVKPNSSACEDIDSIDPLCRFYFMTDYRKADIERALRKAISWILLNQNEDGGFVFRKYEPFMYGHKLMTTAANESAMFPTWFRMLSLAYISKVLPDLQIYHYFKFQFPQSPGYQFWKK
ncbi:MAG: hypothetical protein ACTSRG_24085 [Candidatus Helarchaeota archaeon]